MRSVDLNCDVGEGLDNESQLMPYISSCNIACGGHTGSVESMEKVLKLARYYNVKVGAHPSYPDKKNFGRKPMNMAPRALKTSLRDQIIQLKYLAEKNNQKLHHVKPHGALYNLAAQDEQMAKLIIEVVLEVDSNLKLYVPFNSVIQRLATSQIETVVEGFADRNYTDCYKLVSRSAAYALITKKEKVVDHVIPMLKEQSVTTISGKVVPFRIDTICIHSDTENAVTIAEYLHKAIINAGIEIV